jgi:hypothetical protein
MDTSDHQMKNKIRNVFILVSSDDRFDVSIIIWYQSIDTDIEF